jgi:hypothetical protein
MKAIAYALVSAVTILPVAAGAQVRPPVQRDIARELACSPQSPLERPNDSIKIVGGKDLKKTLFGTGEQVVINAGTAKGLTPGQDYFVRRIVADKFTEFKPGVNPNSVHTVGWVRIMEAQENFAIGTIEHGCDGVIEGDYLEPFTTPRVPARILTGTPDFERPAKIILGDERRQSGATGWLMVIDRGSDHGVRVGHQLTIYRGTVPGGPIVKVGMATVIATRPESSTILIDNSTDAIYIGDFAAIHR